MSIFNPVNGLAKCLSLMPYSKLKSFSKEFPFIPADQFLCLTWMWVKCDTDLLIKPFRYDKYHLLMEIILTWDKVKSRAACPVSPDNIKDLSFQVKKHHHAEGLNLCEMPAAQTAGFKNDISQR